MILRAATLGRPFRRDTMKKDNAKQGKKLLPLRKETMKKLSEADLGEVVGGSSCLPPPPALS
jgi:hypothetical protein